MKVAMVAAAVACAVLSACGGKTSSEPPRAATSPAPTPAVATSDTSTPAATPAPTADASTPAGRHAPEVATGETLTKFQKRRLLGHYSTEDGMSGFILDRTVSPWRAKLDGVKGFAPLSESHGPNHTKEYRADAKGHKIWIRVSEDGDVLLFQGPRQINGVRVVRDADAEQLE